MRRVTLHHKLPFSDHDINYGEQMVNHAKSDILKGRITREEKDNLMAQAGRKAKEMMRWRRMTTKRWETVIVEIVTNPQNVSIRLA